MSPTFSEFVFFSLLSVANGLGRREPEEEEVLRGHHPETDGDDGAAEREQVHLVNGRVGVMTRVTSLVSNQTFF